tara:strand:- start:133 stop:1320 length:1188 start_codon:yes stop_codon:yes gene_type:complete
MGISEEIVNRIKSNIKVHNDGISVHEPSFLNSNASKYLCECIDSGWVSSSGKWVTKFEELIHEFTGSKYVVVVSNGTNALKLSLYMVGVRANDEVFIPPLSFVATANAVSHLGAIPHFIDIEPKSLGMCPLALEKRLNKIAIKKNNLVFNKYTGRRISAVVPVHVFGLPAKIVEIKRICSNWGLPLVEDAAEALGSSVFHNKQKIHCGCLGDFGTLSFNGNKIITTGGGGAILTSNYESFKLAKHISTTAKLNHPWDFFHDQIAWNDRLPNINAALGVSQIEMLEEKLSLKRDLYCKYKQIFEDLKEVEILEESENSESNYWLITLRLKGSNHNTLKNEILRYAHKLKIYLRPSWILLNELPMYENAESGDLKEANNQSNRLINLPSSPQLVSKL